MKAKKTDKILLGTSVTGFVLTSFSFLLVYAEGLQFLPGILFWGGLLLGTVCQLILAMRRRRFFAFYGVPLKKMQKPHCGLLTFGSNRGAVIADYSLLASIVALVVACILTKGTGYFCCIFLTTTVLSLSLHCILNGRIYFHVKNQAKLRQMLERKKANSTDKGEGEHE